MAVNTHDMVLVHRAFKREFGLLPKMVTGVLTNPGERVRIVHDHAREMVSALHHHHQGEDELLWPRLHERAPLQAGLLKRMEAQHHQLSALLDTVERTLPTWVATPRPSTTFELATLLGEISSQLGAHLAEEEEQLLPVAADHLSQNEWAELGRRGMASMPRSRSLVFLAHILEDARPDEARAFLGHVVPPPARVLYRLVGKPRHRRETARQRAGIDSTTASRGAR
jgi:hemerythrin-like domain-containing protein